MVLEPEVFDYIDGDDTVFEQKPLEKWLRKDSLWRSVMEAFGSAWIRNGIRCSWKKCGKQEKHRGNYGKRTGIF